MEYGHTIYTTDGRAQWVPEGCSECDMGTGGIHRFDCPAMIREALRDIDNGDVVVFDSVESLIVDLQAV